MTVSSTTNKVSYSGNGSTTEFAYTFKIFADGDLDVYIRSSTGTETLQTITTDYSVSGAGSDSGGNVTFVTAPATGETVVIQRSVALTQGTDYVENDPFPAESHEDGLDRLTFIAQQIQEQIDRCIKASVTNTFTNSEFTVSAADRANKIFAFDGSGDLSVTQELGTFQGNWAASTTYAARDIVKDTSTNNIFLCNTSHTSSGSQPLTSNTDSAKWDLLVDAASATSSAAAAASSATAAATSATASATSATASAASATTASGHASTAETHKNDAETAKTAAETAQSSAETAQTNAEAAVVDFRDTYYGSFADNSAAETYQTGTNGGTVDNGDLYFNTTSNTLKIYNGSSWQDAALTAADFLTVANNLSDLNNAATALTNLGLTATAAEINTLDGYTGDVTDLNRLDVTTEGESENSKVVTQSSSGVVNINGTLYANLIQTGGSFHGDWDTASSSSGTLTLDLRSSNTTIITLTENITTISLTNMGTNRSGAFLLLIQQDSGGSGYTIDWSTSSGTTIRWKDGTAPTLSSTANDTDGILMLINNVSGTNVIYGWHLGAGFASV